MSTRSAAGVGRRPPALTDPRLFPTASQARETDERYTPAWVFDALGAEFDLDVAAPCGGVPWIPARRHFCAHDDGLAQPWDGLVWLNPPFSRPAAWAARFVMHGHGVMLFPWNTDASWLYRLIRSVPAVVPLEHMKFQHPSHTGQRVPVAIALTALGAGVEPLERLARTRELVLLRPGTA